MTRAGAGRCGHEPRSGLFHEVLGAASAGRPPLLLVHGGGATGACFRTTLDGRPGWADRLAERGHECWVTDWPGCGRSGGVDPLAVGYDDLVAGYLALLRDVIGRPAVVLCHSMGGGIAWALAEHAPGLVAGVVAVAAAYPGNLAPCSRVLADDGAVVEVAFADTGVRFRVDRHRPYRYDDAYVRGQAIATSTHVPAGGEERLRAGFVGMSPRLVLQRLGVEPGLPVVERTEAFAGLRVRLVAGGEDPAHTREIEERTAALLRGWGADAALTWLPDLGIEGNGHFLFAEDNSDEVLAVVERLLEEVVA